MTPPLDLNSIKNLKHRAILDTLINTNLRVCEIANKFDVAHSLVYRVSEKYLGFTTPIVKRTEILKNKEFFESEANATLVNKEPSSNNKVTFIDNEMDAPGSNQSAQLAAPQDTCNKTKESSSEDSVFSACYKPKMVFQKGDFKFEWSYAAGTSSEDILSVIRSLKELM